MGIYLNPSADGFASIMKTGDYVDKTGLITYMNAVLNSSRNMLCSSRPRRFGKSYAAQMLSAFYSKGADAGELFAHLRVANPPEETKRKRKSGTINIVIIVTSCFGIWRGLFPMHRI